MKEVGLWWIRGGRKDRGFGWGEIRDGGQSPEAQGIFQLFHVVNIYLLLTLQNIHTRI